MEYDICNASTAKKIGMFLSMYLQEITDEMNEDKNNKPASEKEESTASSLAKDMLKKNHTKKQTLSSSTTRSVSSEEEEEEEEEEKYASDSDDNSESSEEKIIIVKKTDYAIKLPGQLSSQSATRIQSNSFKKDINGLTTKSQGKSIKQRYVQNLVNDRPHNKLGYDEPDFVIGSTYKTKSSSGGSVATANSKYSKGSSNGSSSHGSNSALNKHINRVNKLDNSTSSRVTTSSTATSNKSNDTSTSVSGGMRYDEMKSIMKSIMRDKTLSKKEMVIKMEEVKAMYSASKARGGGTKESDVPKTSDADGGGESINGTVSIQSVLANSQQSNDTTNNLRNSATSSGEYSWKSNGNQDEVDTSSYTPPQSQSTSSTAGSSSVTTSDDTNNNKEQEEVAVDTDKMKRKEMKAIMKDKTLSKKEMVMRMEAIKAKYDGMKTMGESEVSEGAHVHSVGGGDVYLRGNSMGSAVSSLAPSVAPSITVSSTQDEVNDRNTMSFDEQRRAALQSIMRDKSLTKEERRVKLEEVKQQFSVEASTSTSFQSSARDNSQYASQTDGRRRSSILPGQLSAAAAAEKHRKEIQNLQTSNASSVKARYQENLIKDRPHNKLGVAEPQALLEDKKTKNFQASSVTTKTIMPATANSMAPPQTQESLEEQRRAELQSIMRDKSLTKEERRLKIEEVKAKFATPPTSKRFLAEMDLSAQSYADRPKQEIEEMKETVIPVSQRIAAVNKNVDDDIMKSRRRRSEIAVKDKGRDAAYSKARTRVAANVDPTAFGVMYHQMYGVQRDKKSKARSEYAGRF